MMQPGKRYRNVFSTLTWMNYSPFCCRRILVVMLLLLSQCCTVNAWMTGRMENVGPMKRFESVNPWSGLFASNNQDRCTSTMSLAKSSSILPVARPDTKRAFRNLDHDDQHILLGLEEQQILQYTSQQRRSQRFRVYCDLDGVLVDFSSGIQRLYREDELPQYSSFCVDDLHRRSMWQRVAQADNFFAHLPWTNQGKYLWQVIKKLKPIILTGVPVHPTSSRQQKVDWCRRELGMSKIAHTDKAAIGFRHVSYQAQQHIHLDDNNVCHVITCWSENKHYESGPGAVLIDDRIELKDDWEAKGGIFVHHNGNVQETIDQLEKHGILQEFLSC